VCIAASHNDKQIILEHYFPSSKKMTGQNKIFGIMVGAKSKNFM
jgi:hypothetical protein